MAPCMPSRVPSPTLDVPYVSSVYSATVMLEASKRQDNLCRLATIIHALPADAAWKSFRGACTGLKLGQFPECTFRKERAAQNSCKAPATPELFC